MSEASKASNTEPLHPDSLYPYSAFIRAAGFSQSRIREARLRGVTSHTSQVARTHPMTRQRGDGDAPVQEERFTKQADRMGPPKKGCSSAAGATRQGQPSSPRFVSCPRMPNLLEQLWWQSLERPLRGPCYADFWLFFRTIACSCGLLTRPKTQFVHRYVGESARSTIGAAKLPRVCTPPHDNGMYYEDAMPAYRHNSAAKNAQPRNEE